MKCSPNNNALDCKDNKALIKYELARYISTYLKRFNDIKTNYKYNPENFNSTTNFLFKH